MSDNLDDVLKNDALGQAELVKSKQVKASELVEATIARIKAINPQINSVITALFDEARETANKIIPNGPFAGVPFLLKDLGAELKGAPMSMGSRLLEGYVSPHDTELTRRYKQAGLIILGKTNTPEFGILPTTEPLRFGPTRNPWDLTRSAGGSSGGSAAAVASRILPMAHANDGGGSIRIPASCCGIFGLKPTRGRTSFAPRNDFSGLACEHAVTITVRDSAALLDATWGSVAGDPYMTPKPERPFLDEVSAAPRKLKIGVLNTGCYIEAECEQALHETIKLCKELGHVVEEVKFDLDTKSFASFWIASLASTVASTAKGLHREVSADTVEPLTLAMYEMGRGINAFDFVGTFNSLRELGRKFMQLFDGYDVLLTPTLAQPPLMLGTLDALPENPLAGLIRSGAYAPHTAIANVTGQPAMSVPLYWTPSGLPIGSQFFGRFADESTLFNLAGQLERARPWKDKKP